MSLNYEQRPVIGDRFIDTEYGNPSLHSPLSDFYSDDAARPRLHTWPTSDFFNHSYPIYSEDMERAIMDSSAVALAPQEPHIPVIPVDKRTKKGQSPSKSPTGQQSPRGQQPRRKLTTHKLSAKSYVDLITEAICSGSERRMTLADIYKWMVANVPCFKQQANVSASSGWKNAVRHTLSLHKRFKRVQRGRLQKPAWWTIQEDGVTGVMSTVVGRSPSTEFVPYPRRNSEGCFDIKQEAYTPPCSMSSVDIRQSGMHTVETGLGSQAPTSTPAPAMYNFQLGTPWEMGYDRYDHVTPTPAPTLPTMQSTGSMNTEDEETDSGYGSCINGGSDNYLIRTQSDASSYGSSPYRMKTLTQAYSPIDQEEEEYKVFSKGYQQLQGYNHGQMVPASPINDCQSVLVQTEAGEVAHIRVPMPIRVDVRGQQASQQAQTVMYVNNRDFTKPYFIQTEPTGIPQDLVSVQVDAQVQCNVAEVLAYEMKVCSTPNEPVGDLYDLLKAGCTLD